MNLLQTEEGIKTILDWDNYSRDTLPSLKQQNNALNSLISRSEFIDYESKFHIYKDELVEITPFEIIDSTNSNGNKSTCYLVCFQKIKGSLNKNKLASFKVAGKSIGALLKNGEIQNSEGVKIKLEDVKDPDVAGCGILIIDCRSQTQIQSLINHSIFLALKNDETKSKEFDMSHIVHFGGRNITLDEGYGLWMNSFGDSVSHLFTHEEMDTIKNYEIDNIENSSLFRH